MARDRTLDLHLRMQQGSGQSRHDHHRPSIGSKKRTYEADILKGVLKRTQAVQEDIAKLEDTVFDLKQKQSQFLTSPLMQTEQALTFKMMSQRVHQDAERISHQVDRLRMSRVESPAGARIIENQAIALRQRLENIIKDLNANDSQFEEMLSSRVNRHHAIAGVSLTGSTQSMASSLVEPSILLQGDEELLELQQSEKSLLQIEENIHFVNAMFRDLNFAVHRQQSVVDSIQKHFERTQSYVEKGKRHLQKLSPAKRSRKHFSKLWQKIFGGISLTTAGLIVLSICLAVLL